MNKLFNTLFALGGALKASERKLLYETITKILLSVAGAISDKQSPSFKKFLATLSKEQKASVVNWPKEQEIKGVVKATNLKDFKAPEVKIKSINLQGKRGPKDWIAVQFTDGKNLINF